MKTKVCCVTGHRDIPAKWITYVEQNLRQEVLEAIEARYTRFISGFAGGTDLMFAAIAAEEKKRHPELFLEAAIPYGGRLKTRNEQLHALLQACHSMKVICQEYTPPALCRGTATWSGNLSR